MQILLFFKARQVLVSCCIKNEFKVKDLRKIWVLSKMPDGRDIFQKQTFRGLIFAIKFMRNLLWEVNINIFGCCYVCFDKLTVRSCVFLLRCQFHLERIFNCSNSEVLSLKIHKTILIISILINCSHHDTTLFSQLFALKIFLSTRTFSKEFFSLNL